MNEKRETGPVTATKALREAAVRARDVMRDTGMHPNCITWRECITCQCVADLDSAIRAFDGEAAVEPRVGMWFAYKNGDGEWDTDRVTSVRPSWVDCDFRTVPRAGFLDGQRNNTIRILTGPAPGKDE